MQFYAFGTRIADRYEVAGRPLVGGMGIVYICFDHQEQRPVALKTFKPEFLPDRAARVRFLEEGNTWVRLGKHSHIVRAYRVERIGDGREVYLVLELVAKEQGRKDASLRSWLTPGMPLSVDQALLIALQIVRGMRHATETITGFVHRDLKPENVLVGADRLSNASINRVRVTDFGLVKGFRSEQVSQMQGEDEWIRRPGQLTRAGTVLGTPHYMAPEQWESTDVEVQADIYALGCILGEMVTGRMLVQGSMMGMVRQAHQGGQALAVAHATAPPLLCDLLAGCLTAEPDQRYKDWTAVELAVAAAYAEATGLPAPDAEAGSALSRAERIAAGWSTSAIGYSYLDMGNAKAAMAYFKRACQKGQAEGERHLEAAGLNQLALAYADYGDTQRSVNCYEQALTILREVGDRRGEGAALGNLGSAYAQRGNARQAIDYFEQALAIHCEIGYRLGEGNVLCNLGIAYRQLGDDQRAVDCHEQALVIHREIRDRHGEGDDLGNLGSDYWQLGDTQRSISYYEQALTIRREIGDRHGEGNDLGDLGVAYHQLGDRQRAIGYYEQALAIRREIGDRHGQANDLSNLGVAYRQLGDRQRAIGYYEQALAICREIGNLYGVASTSFNMALLLAQLGDPDRALSLTREAVRLFTEIGHTTNAERAQQLVTQLEQQRG